MTERNNQPLGMFSPMRKIWWGLAASERNNMKGENMAESEDHYYHHYQHCVEQINIQLMHF